MIVISLLKAVPAKTTRVVTVGGVLKREQMDLVMNPHDQKAVEAADFVKRRVGGKVIALSMGPDVKLSTIMKDLYDTEIEGVDENVILSDRRMAGADTLATAYAVSKGISKVLEINRHAIEELMTLLEQGASRDQIRSRALELYEQNLLPNQVFSSIPAARMSIVWNYFSGRATKEETFHKLTEVRDSFERFIILAGIKTSDGETGSVGPQVAEELGEDREVTIPQITYVEDFEIDPNSGDLSVQRKIGGTTQRLETHLPALLTISPDYRPRSVRASSKRSVRDNAYRGKVREPIIWTGDTIGADPERIGLPGSPTIVGPGIDIGKPAMQKFTDRTLLFGKYVEKFERDGKSYGPFEPGDVADDLPSDLIQKLRDENIIEVFGYPHLTVELFIDEARKKS